MSESDKKTEVKDVPADEATTADLKPEPVDATSEVEAVTEPEPEQEPESAQPPLPKRPLSELEKMQKELSELFPDLEPKLLTAVLILSQGELDKSFNALLYYNDPSTMTDEELQSLFLKPKLPERRSGSSSRSSDPRQAQLSEDEKLARKLAKKYSRRERYNDYLNENDAKDDKDTFEKFMEEDLPQIKQQLNKNLDEASTKISSWFGNVSKKFNETGGQEKLFSAIGGGAGAGFGGSSGRTSSSGTTAANARRSSKESKRYNYDFDLDSDSITNQTAGISLENNTTNTSNTESGTNDTDVYGTPKKSVDYNEPKKKISSVKPEPISKDFEDLKTSEKAKALDPPADLTSKGKKDEQLTNDDDFLVDDSDDE